MLSGGSLTGSGCRRGTPELWDAEKNLRLLPPYVGIRGCQVSGMFQFETLAYFRPMFAV